MKHYQSFNEIETDLKRLDLERKIALEEMKFYKSEIVNDLKPSNLINMLLKMAGKYGVYFLMKKFMKK